MGNSVSNITTYTREQEDIKNQMAKNSEMWASSDDETKAYLETQNKQLASVLGSDVTFDPTTGTWSGSASWLDSPSSAENNYSSYISELYSAQTAAALAELEKAYNQNTAELDASEEDIDPYYESARNEAAAASEQSKRNFAEYAGAYGLNSGTGGQAELARSVALQNNLNSLSQGESDAYAELELQRTQLAEEYNAAIAAAESGGAYELASALYQEAVRADETLTASLLSQLQAQY